MRKLSVREWALLICLIIIATGSAYILFFHMPMTERVEELNAQIAQGEELNYHLDAKIVKMHKMERTLKELETQENKIPQMPEYDNLKVVMAELNSILKPTMKYAMAFQAEEGNNNIFRRGVAIPFTCGSYEQTKQILRTLHNSQLRNFLANVQITHKETGVVETNATMTFFEYKDPKGGEQSETEGAKRKESELKILHDTLQEKWGE